MAHSTDFETLLEPILSSALKTAFFLTRHEDDAQDLVQEAAIQAFRAFDRFEDGTNFKAWFLKIQHNCFLNRLRAQARRPQLAEVEDDDALDALLANASLSSKRGNPAGELFARLDAQQIAQALLDLPLEFREVATLYFVHEMPYEHIALVVDCPLNTVRSRLHRGRKLLQRALWSLAQEQGLRPDPALRSEPTASYERKGEREKNPRKREQKPPSEH